MSTETKEGEGDKAAVKVDERLTQLTARVLRMFDTKSDKMAKSLADAEAA
jgi:hypothetical protein